jgi:serine/threonine-protein kinase HipA
MMRLANKLGLMAPPVHRKYVPEPVYLIERFDRYLDEAGCTQRQHIIDACQLLNKPRGFKYKSANLQTLAECIEKCRNRVSARLQLYRWLMFNVLIANDDNHLKNISFLVNAEGINLSPTYDMLCTSVYRTVAIADHRAIWPEVEMMIPLPGATRFSQVTRESVLKAGEVLGLTLRICERELDRMTESLPPALTDLIEEIETQNAAYPELVRVFLRGELRVVRAIKHIVVADMLARVSRSKAILS